MKMIRFVVVVVVIVVVDIEEGNGVYWVSGSPRVVVEGRRGC